MMRDRIDVEWMLINSRVKRAWGGEWRGWIQAGQHEYVPTPGSTNGTEIDEEEDT